MWRQTDGQTFNFKSLKGHLVLVAMVYTRCKASCPLTIAKLKDIEVAFHEKGVNDVQIVMASFDPKNDTPEKLLEFLKNRKLDPNRWRMLAPNKDSSVRELAAVTGTVYSRDEEGEYSHSNVISLLDKKGVIRAHIDGLDAENGILVQAALREKNGG